MDISGRPLRYKIIVADMKIFCILYNTGRSVEQVPFEEIRRNVGDYVTFNDQMGSGKSFFGQITHIPVCMIATPDKEGLTSVMQGQVKNHLAAHCVSRCFEKLPGYIDIQIESEDGMSNLLAH